MQVIFRLIKANKKTIIKYLIIIIVLILLKILLNYVSENKVFISKPYIYTISETEEEYSSKLPYINVEGEEISLLNSELMTKYYTIIDIDRKQMTYEYYKSKKYLSLIIKIYDKENIDVIPLETLIYNIDIKNTKLLTDKELFNLFEISEEEINNILYKEIKEYYNYGINNNYYNKECDYECFIEDYNITPFLDNNIYYIKDNYLMTYKFFLLNSEFVYDESNPFNLYHFKIKSR